MRQLSSTINSDSAAPGDAAMALYLRGIAYRKMGESARAIADLGRRHLAWAARAGQGQGSGQSRACLSNRPDLTREGDAELAAARKIGGGKVEALIAEGGGSTRRRRRDRRFLDRGPAGG